MKDSFGRPIATLNVLLIRVEKTETSLKMSVIFETSLDLNDITTFSSDEELRAYLSSFLMNHIRDWYWRVRDER